MFCGQVAGGAYFGAINSPFRDDAYLLADFKINAATVQSGNSGLTTFAVNEGAATKGISAVANSYTLNLSPSPKPLRLRRGFSCMSPLRKKLSLQG